MTLRDLSLEVTDRPGHLVAVLESHRSELPFADEALALLLPLLEQLVHQQELGERAIARWRTALAKRWQAEVIAQRLYNQALRQLNDTRHPDLDLILGVPQPLGPSELLEALRRLHGALRLCAPLPAVAPELSEQLARASNDLEGAITLAKQHEAERRRATLEYRIVRDAYERAGLMIYQRLIDHCGLDQRIVNMDIHSL